jgi:hypothetical protein
MILGTSAFVVLMIGLVSLPGHKAGSASANTRFAPGAQVTIPSLAPVRVVPRSFFGISTEYWTLPLFERNPRLLERVLSLLHVPGNGPMVMRIGGDSADHARWDPRGSWMAPWVFRITRSWLAATAGLVRAEHLHVILDMNLVTGSARSAAQWARAAERSFPRGSIIAFEIGNEPDIYDRSLWVALLARAHDGRLPSDITPRIYRSDFSTYGRLLSRVAPRIPLAGPALANPQMNLRWIIRLLADPPAGLRLFTAHRYPYSACAARGWSGYPTIARVLSQRATTGVVDSIRPALLRAHRAGFPFRLTELNSVTCGGLRGVSDTFATALWAPDALFSLLRAGVDGVNLHSREYSINAPFTITSHGLHANPLLYGMITFARTLGPQAELLQTRLHAPASAHLDAWAVRVHGNRIHVLLIDKGVRPVTVGVHMPASGPLSVQRLIARSVSAKTGETLAGQHLGRDGRWHGRRVTVRVSPSVHGYVVTLPAHSAALLSAHTK